MHRLLLISYYWPPAGGAPVQRVLKWARYLPEFGWLPHILTVENGAYSSRDPQLADQVPEAVTVSRTPAVDPFSLYARLTGRSAEQAVSVGFASDRVPDWRERLSRWVRANIFIPDARVGWVPFARRAGGRLIQQIPFEAILSSGPPHSAHLAARILHRRSGIPWVADFRDPWTDIDYLAGLPETRWSRAMNARLEKSVLRDADAVVTVSPSLQSLLREKGAGGPVELVYNGFDEEDFRDLPAADAEVFWITYAGTMNAERNPHALWSILDELRQAGEASRIRVRLVGTMDASVRESVRRHNLESVVEFTGQCSHAEVVNLLARSGMLLVVVNRVDSAGQAGILPTKLFEYLAAGRPILALGPGRSDLGSVLEETRAGRLIVYDDRPALREYVRSSYAKWLDSGHEARFGLPEAVAAFSRRAGARRMARILDGVVERRSKTGQR